LTSDVSWAQNIPKMRLLRGLRSGPGPRWGSLQHPQTSDGLGKIGEAEKGKAGQRERERECVCGRGRNKEEGKGGINWRQNSVL